MIEIDHRLKPSVYGVGYRGIGKYSSSNKSYKIWQSMLQRCYDPKYHKTKPSYIKCEVHQEWHNFQNFAKWFEKRYTVEKMLGWALDKDILIKGNRIYSPEACCLVPLEINSLFIKSGKSRGKYPIGVTKSGKKFRARFGKDRDHLGIFNTPEEAFQVYKIAKEIYIKEIAYKWRSKITEACYSALINYQVEITD